MPKSISLSDHDILATFCIRHRTHGMRKATNCMNVLSQNYYNYENLESALERTVFGNSVVTISSCMLWAPKSELSVSELQQQRTDYERHI